MTGISWRKASSRGPTAVAEQWDTIPQGLRPSSERALGHDGRYSLQVK